jgi:predicted transcriptional regulator of viral defense system
MSGLMRLAELAGEQWGLVTTGQAAQIGVPAGPMSRWVDQGALTRITHGIYKITGSPHDPLDELRAAWLGLAPKRTAADRLAQPHIDAVVSHRSAAALHGLGDLDADVHEFIVQGRRQSRRRDVRIHTRTAPIESASWTRVAGLPVTTVLSTILDLAAQHIDGGHLAGVVRDAVATAAVDLDELSEALAPYAHHYGAVAGDGTALVQRLLLEAGLPRTTEQAGELVRAPQTSEALVTALSTNMSPELLRSFRAITDDPAFNKLAQDSVPASAKKAIAEAIRMAADTNRQVER